jgi:hypothetical protein
MCHVSRKGRGAGADVATSPAWGEELGAYLVGGDGDFADGPEVR